MKNLKYISILLFFIKRSIFRVCVMMVCTLFFMAFSCSKSNKVEQECEIYENHDISACGINDPLQNIEWMRKYCESIDKQYFLSINIDLYKVIDTDEHLFKIGVSYSDFEYSPCLYSESWKNCIGELIFGISSCVPPIPGLVEEFLKDKEYVAELFHFIKQ